ncbi:MAG: nucleotidyltransferase domain-containing protein [Chloroflexia bacterium]|nr:nucleotidyltransferase domain-containing protein [Chloroflexia bacterium]
MIAAIEQNLDAIRALCREYGVVRLEVFGSAATAEFDPARSDIDFLVDYASETDPGPWLKHFFKLRDELTVLLGHRVDLVMASAPALENTYFRREAEKTRTIIYDATKVVEMA